MIRRLSIMSYLSLDKQTSLLFDSLRTVDELYGRYAKSVGLTSLGLIVLDIIYNMSNNCTQKVICEKTNLPKQTVNAIIRSFWEEGYIELKEIDTDRRNKEIRLSKSGQEYGDRVIGELIKAKKQTLGQFTYEQRQLMIDFMKKLEMSLQEITKVK